MKRRNFILSAGALATISFTLTGSMASFADAVSPTTDFRIAPESIEGLIQAESFTLDPDSENTESQHVWEVNVSSNETIDRIEADYDLDGDNASFNPLTSSDITVEFYDASTGNPRYETVPLVSATYSGSTAVFDIDGGADVDQDARITIGGDVSAGDPGIVNPSAGTYQPILTFVEADGDTVDYYATLTTSTGDGLFEVSNLTVSSTNVDVGDDIVFEFDVTNTGAGTDTRNIDLNLDRGSGFTEVDTQAFTLDPSETRTNQTFSYTAQSQDTPDFVAQIEDDTSAPPQSPTISVTGGWTLTLSRAGGNASVHTWSTNGIDFSEDVDTITVRYPSSVFRQSLDFNQSNPTVTIDLTNTTNVSKTESTSNGGHTATWDLADGSADTSISGSASIEIDSLRDPKNGGTYEAEIELVGVSGETYTAIQSFTI